MGFSKHLKRIYVSSTGIGRFIKPRSLPVPMMALKNSKRLLYQQRLFNKISNIEGDVVECGVGWGVSFLLWATLCLDEAEGRSLYGFDSFEGFPVPTEEDHSPRMPRKGQWSVATPESTLRLLHEVGFKQAWLNDHVSLIKGYFHNTLHLYQGKSIALLHIDVDLYDSYKVVLEALYDKVAPGGVIAFDEYLESEKKWPGACKAIDEFFQDKPFTPIHDIKFNKYYFIKN